jgi:hypothetical protein
MYVFSSTLKNMHIGAANKKKKTFFDWNQPKFGNLQFYMGSIISTLLCIQFVRSARCLI